jgi:hypothetical protein
MSNPIFSSDVYRDVEDRVRAFLNSHEEYLSPISQRQSCHGQPQYSRKKWMVEMCDTLLEFYPREILKINDRIEHFRRVRDYWMAQPDD